MTYEYFCREHRIGAVVDPARRSIRVEAVGVIHGGCRLLTAVHAAMPRPGEAEDARVEAPLGDHGPVHPETGRAVCHILCRQRTSPEEWRQATGG
jgi:hypothetical protein